MTPARRYAGAAGAAALIAVALFALMPFLVAMEFDKHHRPIMGLIDDCFFNCDPVTYVEEEETTEGNTVVICGFPPPEPLPTYTLEKVNLSAMTTPLVMEEPKLEYKIAADLPVRNARPTHILAPSWPQEGPTGRGRAGGWVLLRYVVTPSGLATDIEVVDSSSSHFHRAAKDALRKSTFTPRTKFGLPVRSKERTTRYVFEVAGNET